MEAAGLKEGVYGLDPDDPETGRLVIETMKEKPDPLVAKALIHPTAPAPEVTLRTAWFLQYADSHATVQTGCLSPSTAPQNSYPETTIQPSCSIHPSR